MQKLFLFEAVPKMSTLTDFPELIHTFSRRYILKGRFQHYYLSYSIPLPDCSMLSGYSLPFFVIASKRKK